MSKIVLECSILQLHNEFIDSLDDGGLLGARYADSHDVIFSETVLHSLSPPQLCPITDNHKIMCGCAVCNTSKCFQVSLNVWRRKQIKIMKDKADNSRVRKKDGLTQAYKSYADYAFPSNKTFHTCCENAADYVLCTPTNDEYQFPNWKLFLLKCTACTSFAIQGFEIYLSNREPMLMFNMYMTQFTCSYHGILIHKKTTTYLDAKRKSKNTCFLCEQIFQTTTPDFICRRLYERVKLFSIQRKIGDFHKYCYIKQIKNLSYHRSYYKILEKIILLTLDIKH